MEPNGLLYRVFFFILSCIAATAYEFAATNSDIMSILFIGLSKGSLAFLLIAAVDMSIKRISLRAINTVVVGTALGALLGFTIATTIQSLFHCCGIKSTSEISNFLVLFSYLASLYLTIRAAFSAAEVWWLSIPFVQLSPVGQLKKNKILLDISAIEDSRLSELARSGLLDHQLILPTFILKEIQKGIEAQDEIIKTRYRKCFEQIKRLESMPNLGLQQQDFHVSELDDLATKLLQAAKLVSAHIITAEQSCFKQGEEESVVIIGLEAIANAIKPSAQRGEMLQIKIQRLGKEPKQGVGYLEDGTMVVVNGGGEFLGETVKTMVLSQKYSSSGKIIFCNALTHDEKGLLRPVPGTQTNLPEDAHFVSPYAFAVADKRDDSIVPQPIPRIKRDTPSYERTAIQHPWNRH